MREINAYPPNIAEICKVFPGVQRPGVIFSYAPDVYVPGGHTLPPSLVAHESVHVERQLVMGVEAWWDKYLVDTRFRYDEELLAHRAEYHSLKENAPTRQMRRAALKIVAKRLASGLYGKLVTPAQAADDIIAGSTVGEHHEQR